MWTMCEILKAFFFKVMQIINVGSDRGKLCKSNVKTCTDVT